MATDKKAAFARKLAMIEAGDPEPDQDEQLHPVCHQDLYLSYLKIGKVFAKPTRKIVLICFNVSLTSSKV
jgi:hypothetical protein